MKQNIEKNALFLTPEIFKTSRNLIAGQSTRHGGKSQASFDSLNLSFSVGDDENTVQENRLRLCGHLGITPDRLATSTQVHGSSVIKVTRPGQYEEYDALITNKRQIFLGIYIADCVPVLIYDPENQAVAAVHSGWKGTQLAIVQTTLETMASEFGTQYKECLAYVGTCIQGCDYEVGHDVAQHFNSAYLTKRKEPGKWLLDLSLANSDQLISMGVKSGKIERSFFSTFKDHIHFFSHRYSKGRTGRMMALIGMK
jgi:hypothetical protein